VLTGGVASSYQLREPWPIYLEHGDGPRVWDVDGNEMYDFHNGFGSMVQGHAHPAIGRAIAERYARARTSPRRPRTRSSSARSSRGAWAPALALHELRLGVDDGRDPHRARLHQARHGDEDLRLLPRPPRHGDGLDRGRVRQDRPARAPASLPYGAGIPQATVDEVFAVHFNDAESMERRIVALDARAASPPA
jgi:glutamate-1-semialdehyde 2,1-aminomutase